VSVQGSQIVILEQVKFRTGSAEILPESAGILDAVSKALKDHPEIGKLRVEGHTDNQGAAAGNKWLSQRRAASVVAALVKRGVEAARLTPQGFGQERPIDTNATEPGRQNNRRVEFHIVPMTP
jgi:outer membrane protein OmpA-like peptidoglycan-associated protein